MKKLLLILFVFSLFTPIFAQAQGDYTCDSEAFLNAVSQAKPTGDLAANQKIIAVIEQALRDYRTACAEYKWEGKGSNVTDLFELPKGVYRAEFKTSYISMTELEVIAGECSMDSVSQLEEGDVTQSRLIRSEGCTAVLQISSYKSSAPWTITITKLD